MKTQTNTKPADDKPVTDNPITNAVKAVTEPLIGKLRELQSKLDKAKTAHTDATDAATGGRVGIVMTLVDEALKHSWPHNYAMAGIDAAIESLRLNQKDNTLSQFRAEANRALHPKAREHVRADLTEAAKRWDAETKAVSEAKAAADKAGVTFDRDAVDTPLHDAFKRSSFVVLQANGMADHRAADGEHVEDMGEFCRDFTAKRQRDPKLLQRAVAKALATLRDVNVVFPHEALDSCLEYLEEVDIVKAAKEADAAAARKAKGMSRLRKSAARKGGDTAAAGKVADELLETE